MQVIVNIPETRRPGIAHARAQYNASIPATVQDGEVQDGTTEEGVPIMVPNVVPNPALLASDEDYIIWVMDHATVSYMKNVPGPTPEPTPDPGEVNGVPQEVTRRQARQALAASGKLALVQPAIDALPEPQRTMMQIEWDDSTVFQRQRESLILMGTAIGLNSAQLDQLFITAATL